MSTKSMQGRKAEDVRNDYEGFVEKFKPKKTTDDCYTPPIVYETIKEWACEHYGIDRQKIVRPFYPGGDYETYEYKEGEIVLDNPPFSILSKIIDFYLRRNIHFFLFAPGLTLFSPMEREKVNAVVTDANIVYENGAVIKTGFITTLGDYAIEGSAELNQKIKEAMKEIEGNKAGKPKYKYPKEVLMVNDVKKLVNRGISIKIERKGISFTRRLDSQKIEARGMYGSGFLLSKEEAAKVEAAKVEAAKVEATNAKTYTWKLSEREKEIISKMSQTTD